LESEFSRAVIEQAQEVVVVADRSKFGRVGLAKICKMDEIDILITNPPIPKGVASKLHSMNVKLITDFTHIK
jgi:DeoR/GlpR family transcriptional regulator of sugar metabolism